MIKKVVLCKTTLDKINKFFKYLEKEREDIDDDFKEYFIENIKSEVKNLKECSEKSICDFYIEKAKEFLVEKQLVIDSVFYTLLKERVRKKLIAKYTSNKSFDNNIDIYFNEVKREYIRHPVNEQNDLELIPENKDVFIKNNLKLVIECAKRYQNLGITFEDLIQAGNEGLMVAWDKFDKNRAKLQKNIIKNIEKSMHDEFTYQEAVNIIKMSFSYSKNLEQTIKLLPDNGFKSKSEFIAWVKKNIKTAVFASVAFQWIRAYIKIELSKYSKIIRIPKTSKEDKEIPVTFINLDSLNPHTNDCYHDNQISEVVNDEFMIEDESIENTERNDVFKSIVNNCLGKLDSFNRRIVMKRYGIGLPYQLSINEIAESEGLSSNKIKYALTTSMKVIAEHINPQDRETLLEMLG